MFSRVGRIPCTQASSIGYMVKVCPSGNLLPQLQARHTTRSIRTAQRLRQNLRRHPNLHKSAAGMLRDVA